MTPDNSLKYRILLVFAMLWTTSCDELSARRQIQRAGEMFNEGKYAEALDEYEEALEKAPDLQTGHHNAGITAYRAFQSGVVTDRNKYFAERASYHFKVYLAKHPEDEEIIGLLTNIWLDSDQVEDALAYWSERNEATPNDIGVLEKLGTINRQAQKYDDALACDYKRAELATDDAGRIKAYMDIAGLQLSRLTDPKVVDADRVAIADEGIAAMQKALELQPNNPTANSVIGSLYQFRSVTHYASWARVIDAASQRRFQLRYSELKKAEKEKAAKGSANQAAAQGGQDKTPSLGQNKEKPEE